MFCVYSSVYITEYILNPQSMHDGLDNGYTTSLTLFMCKRWIGLQVDLCALLQPSVGASCLQNVCSLGSEAGHPEPKHCRESSSRHAGEKSEVQWRLRALRWAKETQKEEEK